MEALELQIDPENKKVLIYVYKRPGDQGSQMNIQAQPRSKLGPWEAHQIRVDLGQVNHPAYSTSRTRHEPSTSIQGDNHLACSHAPLRSTFETVTTTKTVFKGG